MAGREGQLSTQEIERVVETAAHGGVKRIRLTGGEPLVHPHIVEIVHRIALVKGIEEVSQPPMRCYSNGLHNH